ncbi:MAG: aldose epimerase [Microcoleaceae cyanobacterium]
MFAIEQEQKQYKTYVLSDDTAQSCLEVVPERGGLITRWQVAAEEILYLDQPRFAQPDLSVRGGIPILFPICGNLPNDIFSYQGRQYHLKQHGFARTSPWTVTEQNTEGKAAITLKLTSNDETREVYPFDFELEFTYTLKGNDLEIFQRFTNLSGTMDTIPARVMPFSTGLHPYFLTHDKTQLRFEIPAIQYQDQDTHEFHDFTGSFDAEAEEIDVIFGSLTGLATLAYDDQRHLRVAMSYSAAYANVVYWTVGGKDYYCLEPWTAPRNALNSDRQLIYLKPEESCEMLVHLNATFFE